MKNTNRFGFSDDYVSSAIDKLNELLADVQVFYMNVRGFHWNIKGNKFFILHEKFEDLYNELAENADEIAERILMLGGKPVHAFSDYLKMSKLGEVKDQDTDTGTVKNVLESMKLLLSKEREISVEAADAGDEGTVDLVTGFISSQEKKVWMYDAFLS
ncbi:MAG: DNA starvation/stationary phase protection protein [Bacteroidales bacterium]|jgi:starvation-inducible DNA-binding protein